MTSALFAFVMMGSMVAMAQLMLLLERARRETERNRETLALMAQTAPVGLCLTDRDGYLEAINPVARQLLNIDSDKMERFPDFIRRLCPDPALVDQAAFALQLDDSVLQIVRKKIPVGDRSVGEIWFVEDISAHVQLDELIPKAASLETVKNIAANIAHVFNNQLTVISGSAELLAFSASSSQDASMHTETLRAAIEQCSQITRDFLLLTQERPVQQEHIDLHQTIANLNGTTSLHVRATGDTATLDVDPSAFSRAFKELLTNSEEAGASAVVVDCSLTQDGFVELKVRDDGRGLDGQMQHRLFEPFFSMKAQPLGSGLGLSVVDSIVRAHGGKTGVDSPNHEIEISMTWPVVQS